ncbi:MAG: putative Ig domain-containing protein, partial [Mycoplasmataceae bacterium]|nr:putative Ig domain-containing protein [Mycoplasmataceae bacterium]
YKSIMNTVFSNNFSVLSYENNNYLSYTFSGISFTVMSSTNNIGGVNRWVYPLYNGYFYINTLNIPITKTISIIINSNTLPVYTIPNITLDIELLGSEKQLIIPAGTYNYSSFNQLFINYTNNYFNATGIVTNFLDIPYFDYTRLIVQSTGSFIIRNNNELNKYYGLLHTIFTSDFNIDTTKSQYKFPCNMPPVYRSLYIPDGSYSVNNLVNYINNNSEYHYTRNEINSLSYTQFLAKVVDNDIVIYTDDSSEFFINPICKVNTYQESNFANEHRLCSCPYDILSYNVLDNYLIYEDIMIVPINPDNLSNFTATGLPDGLTIDTHSGIISGILNPVNEYKNYNVIVSSGYVNATVNINIVKTNYNIIVKNNIFDYDK